MNSSNKTMVPEAQDAMNRFKMEAANDVGGQMVKKMIKSYEESMK